MNDYQPISTAPKNKVISTAIIDEKGFRNNTNLRQDYHGLWWLADGSMYVYYTPTHWKPAD